MELHESTLAVEEEQNISLKDSSKKLNRNPFTPLILQKNTQLMLHKQYRRENFFYSTIYTWTQFAQHRADIQLDQQPNKNRR